MAAHNIFGMEGEALAASYLEQKGFSILHRNWRSSYYEIDIIAIKEDKLHIVEVKARSSKKWGMPEEAVTKTKFNRLLQAADEFLHKHRQYKHVQYDVLALLKQKDAPLEYFLIEDVYF
ncbi:MAG TPA: YraN family protein [Flavisolibacter sp.]|jgi:putative endonuclease|nr:YraN family protein [Flavisolibacter sp.]